MGLPQSNDTPCGSKEISSRTVVLHKEMWVIQIKTSGAKGESLELLHLSLSVLEILYLIQPDPQKKSGPRCLLLPVQSC